MSDKILANVAVIVNNMAVSIVPNSLGYNEGLGEQKPKVAAAGGGQVDILIADDVSTHIGKVKFELYPTASNITLVRGWKVNGSANVVKLTDNDSFHKTFTKQTLVNDPDIKLSSDGNIQVEFKGAAAA